MARRRLARRPAVRVAVSVRSLRIVRSVELVDSSDDDSVPKCARSCLVRGLLIENFIFNLILKHMIYKNININLD